MVRKEIQDETDRVAGKNQISPIPIHLSIYSPIGMTILSYMVVSTLHYEI